MKPDIPVMRRDELTLLLIDIQPMFWETKSGSISGLAERLRHLLMLASAWQLPTIATLEQPLSRKGSLVEFLVPVFPPQGMLWEKNSFNCCGEPEIVDQFTGRPGRQVALAGAETDVCVLQSALGLLKLGFDVFLIEDCVFSSAADTSAASRRMFQAGVVPVTWKSLAYELAGRVNEAPWLAEAQSGVVRLPSEFQAPETI
ncbi:MAG: isochorismatase family protein [Planctomycetaceae bacterium]